MILPFERNSVGAPNDTPIICPAHPPRILSSNTCRESVRIFGPAPKPECGPIMTREHARSPVRRVRQDMGTILLGWRLEVEGSIAFTPPRPHSIGR